MKIQGQKKWEEEYKNTILEHDHPLIYLFAKANGDIFARDKYLLTPLHYAVAHNNLAGVKQLIKLKADIEVNLLTNLIIKYSIYFRLEIVKIFVHYI